MENNQHQVKQDDKEVVKKIMIAGEEFEVKKNAAINPSVTSEQSFEALEKIIKSTEKTETDQPTDKTDGGKLPDKSS